MVSAAAIKGQAAASFFQKCLPNARRLTECTQLSDLKYARSVNYLCDKKIFDKTAWTRLFFLVIRHCYTRQKQSNTVKFL